MVTTRSARLRRRLAPSPPPPRSPRSTGGEASPEDLLESTDNASATSPFACRICLDTSDNPVVTHCGHLFCWACLYRWLYLYSLVRDCPVCKTEVDVETNHAAVVPIYGSGSLEGKEHDVPPRPKVNRDSDAKRVLDEVDQLLDRARLLVGRASVHLMIVDQFLLDISPSLGNEDGDGRGSLEDEVVAVFGAELETRSSTERLRRTREEAGTDVLAARRTRRRADS